MDPEEQVELINSLVERYDIYKFGESINGLSLFFDEETEKYLDDVMKLLTKNNIEFEQEDSYLYITYN